MTLTTYQIEQLRKKAGLQPLSAGGGVTKSLADTIGASAIVDAPAPAPEPVVPKQDTGFLGSEINFGQSIADSLFSGKASDQVAKSTASHAQDIQNLVDLKKKNEAEGKDTSHLTTLITQLMKEDPSAYGGNIADIIPSVNKKPMQIVGEGAGVATDLLSLAGGLNATVSGAAYGLTHALQQDKGVEGALVDTAIGAIGGKIAEYGFKAVAPFIDKAVSKFGTPLLEKLTPHLPQNVIPTLEKIAEKASIGTGTGGTDLLNKFVNAPIDAIATVPENIARTVLQIPRTAQENIAKVFTGTKVKGLGDVANQKGVQDAVGALSTIKENAPNITVTDVNGVEKPFDPTKATFLELPQALYQTKKAIYDNYTKIATEAGDAGVNFGQKDFLDLKAVLEKYNGEGYTPAYSNKAKQFIDAIDRFGKLNPKDGQVYFKNVDPAKIQSLIEKVNKDVEIGGSSAGNDVANEFSSEIRKLLDSKIESSGNPAYQAVRDQYAQLRSVEGDVLNKYKKALREAGANPSLIDHITSMDALYGVLSGNPVHVALGLGTKAFKATLGKALGAEANLRRAFTLLGDTITK